MISTSSASAGTGDLATWIGAAGTWAVGILAGIIAWFQYRNSVFRPLASPFIEPDRQRIAIRVINKGGAAGMVERIELTPGDSGAPLIDYKWQGWESRDPVPFILPGKASSVLLLKMDRPVAADVVAIVRYGNGKNSGRLKLLQTKGSLVEKTTLPPGSIAIRVPPIDGAPDFSSEQ